jgi:hypothetical protein
MQRNFKQEGSVKKNDMKNENTLGEPEKEEKNSGTLGPQTTITTCNGKYVNGVCEKCGLPPFASGFIDRCTRWGQPIVHKKVEERVEEKGLQEDRQITQALNVITFLTEFVHGRVNGRREDKNELALLNAIDHFRNLTKKS